MQIDISASYLLENGEDPVPLYVSREELEQAENTISQLKKEIAQLELSLEDLRVTESALRTDLYHMEDQLSKQKSLKIQDQQAFEECKNQFNSEITTLKQTIGTYSEENNSLTSQLSTLTTKHTELQKLLTTLKKELSSCQADADASKNEVKALRNETTQLRSQIQQLQHNNNELSRQIRASEKAFAEFKQTNNRKIHDLEKTLKQNEKESEKEKKSLSKQVNVYQQQINQLTTSMEKYDESLAKYKNQLVQTQAKLSKVNDEKAQSEKVLRDCFEREVEQLKGEIVAQKQKILNLSREKEQLESYIRTLESERAKERGQLSSNLTTLKQSISQKEKETAQKEKQLGELNERLMSSQRKINHLMVEKKEIFDELKETKKQNSKMLTEVAALKKLTSKRQRHPVHISIVSDPIELFETIFCSVGRSAGVLKCLMSTEYVDGHQLFDLMVKYSLTLVNITLSTGFQVCLFISLKRNRELSCPIQIYLLKDSQYCRCDQLSNCDYAGITVNGHSLEILGLVLNGYCCVLSQFEECFTQGFTMEEVTGSRVGVGEIGKVQVFTVSN
ncbi:hypothetical protein P9112_003297 [Eukaryota sp. TZLM1-RC]